ncbi:2-hydroxyacyl-CoA dehydratase [Dyella sp. BiH032]|uniref:2-hydroxyacyl-CoA dehydratase n=1 Tax=Dyella sp. BiH032 TaxID=3075430 RepID=UPI002892B87C|nr:2-hydroxyacyl-CoA dehydratase [Dyella sp. BiH032]WNL46310.1 2-hydroxyacyl-CoA dehydratase [Dyella sp. BiH032]
MTIPKDAFRRFQEELAELERKKDADAGQPTGATRMARAKEEFLDLRKRYGLTVADVVAFFPEEEGIGYIQSLIAASEAKPRRGRKPKAS